MVLQTLTMYSKYTFNNNSFTKDNVIKLIDYITTMPYSETDNDISYKYPFNASELLKCDNTTICEIIFKILSFPFNNVTPTNIIAISINNVTNLAETNLPASATLFLFLLSNTYFLFVT